MRPLLLFFLGAGKLLNCASPSTPPPQTETPAVNSNPHLPALPPTESGKDPDGYLEKIQKTITNNWKHSQTFYGRTKVYFKIHRDGSISMLKIDVSSGNLEFDQSAVLAVKRSSPFRPLPKGFTNEFLGVYYWFNSNQDNAIQKITFVNTNQDFPFNWYLQYICNHTEPNWFNPKNITGKALVLISIERDGNLKEARIQTSSGDPLFDSSTLTAIKRTFPVPHLPNGYKNDLLQFSLQFSNSPK